MARRNGIAEDLLKITATLPWWVGIALAVAVYVLLQPYAILETPIQAVPGQIGHQVAGQMIRMFAYYGQYILPLLFLSGALASFLKQRKRKNLVWVARNEKSNDPLHDISWKDFELLVGEVFRLLRMAVEEPMRELIWYSRKVVKYSSFSASSGALIKCRSMLRVNCLV